MTNSRSPLRSEAKCGTSNATGLMNFTAFGAKLMIRQARASHSSIGGIREGLRDLLKYKHTTVWVRDAFKLVQFRVMRELGEI
jgi:hypothetical protein